MTWDSVHGFTGLLVFVIDLLILVVLVVRHFLAVLPISDLRPLVYLEMVRFESWTWSCLFPRGVVMKSCVRIY